MTSLNELFFPFLRPLQDQTAIAGVGRTKQGWLPG
jgi:hypothetical protein